MPHAMNLQDAYYQVRFENHFLRAKGIEFQSFFEKLMGYAYRGDFMACRPWGNRGDRKNDGFLKSERRLFQVYAPDEMTERDAIKKINEDFEGAKTHWGEYFDKWVFVHNAADGLPPHVQQLLLDFEKASNGITLETWGLPELQCVFHKVSLADRVNWLGAAPTEETKANLGFADLRPILESISQRSAPTNTAVRDVPMGKIEANALSESVATLIKSGMVKAPLVGDFFDKWHDESLGECIAEAFRGEYRRLRDNFTPNVIFAELQSWVGGGQRGTPEHEMAVLAIIAYYFDSCDIFEEPRVSKL